MKIRVNQHNVEIIKEQTEPINEKEINVSKCEFEFDDAITDNFVKEAYFTLNGEAYKQIIIDNECDYPGEVLEQKGTLEIGVVAYLVDGGNITRYNPSPDYFESWVGSLKDAENSEPITPSEMEQFEQALQDGLNEVDSKLDDVDDKIEEVDGKIIEVNTAITETNNLDLDVSDKIDGDVTVTLTKKDASTKTVTLSDGTSLMFDWQGTSLGIKTDKDEEYTYVDLQGIQGPIGPQGEAFQIKKTYSSVAEMNADFDNMQLGDYVMIASTVEVEDNAKLYTRGENEWIFISDFSGAQGIKGETGLTPNIQIGTVVSGVTPNVTRTGTNENPVLNFVLQKGDKGDTGDTGATGNGIASITKTSTSGLVDTYTITFTSGNTATFTVTNGNGIDRIELTSQSGATKVYTIYYTDGTTSEYTVQDGEVTQEVFDEEVDRLKMVYNAMPKVSGEGTDITLNNTAECPVYDVELSPSELEQGTNPSPDNPQTVHTVSGENTITIENKNLLNRENCIEDGILAWANGTPVYGSTYENSLISNYIRVELNQTYSFNHSASMFFYDKNKNYLGALQNNGTTIAKYSGKVATGLTIPNISEIYYMRLSFRASSTSPDYTTTDMMVNKGTTLLDYVPHQEQSLPLSLGDLEYCKIGDYEDLFFKNVVGSDSYDSTLELNKWYLKKNIGKVVLDGTELWSNSSDGTKKAFYVNSSSSFYTDNNYKKIRYKKYCDNFTYEEKNWRDASSISLCENTNNGELLIFRQDNISSLEDWKTWLGTHNTTVYYVLATPTYTLLSDTLQTQLDNIQKAISYQDQTNVSQTNNDLPFVIKLSAIRDLSGIFEEI